MAIPLLVAALMGVWVYSDARARNASRPEWWAIGTFLLAIVFLPLWLLRRPRAFARQHGDGPRRCPFCVEPVQPTADACMHCGRDLPAESR